MIQTDTNLVVLLGSPTSHVMGFDGRHPSWQGLERCFHPQPYTQQKELSHETIHLRVSQRKIGARMYYWTYVYPIVRLNDHQSPNRNRNEKKNVRLCCCFLWYFTTHLLSSLVNI